MAFEVCWVCGYRFYILTLLRLYSPTCSVMEIFPYVNEPSRSRSVYPYIHGGAVEVGDVRCLVVGLWMLSCW
jgi:hypothetical protein